MAISSEIIGNRPNTATTIRVTEKHTDSVSGNVFKKSYVADKGYDTEARKLANGSSVQSDLVKQEIRDAVALYESGGDPLFNLNQDKITPLYQTWVELATATIRNFLHRVNKMDLYAIESVELTMSLVDRKVVYGMTAPQINVVDQDVNDAVSTRSDLLTYTPPYVEGIKQ